MQEEARYLKRKVKGGHIDVHPVKQAIVVHYEVEATILADSGEAILGDKKQCQKLIRVKALSPQTNIPQLAEEIIGKCELIHPSKAPEVEQLLHYLLQRQSSMPAEKEEATMNLQPNYPGEEKPSEKANINDLDVYIEYLYEDMPEKIRGTSLVLQLTRLPDNLEEVVANETLIGALARVLKEDGKKNIELVTNIIYIFFCVSTFSVFHPIIAQHQIGSMTMRIIDNEVIRHTTWLTALEKLKAGVKETPTDKSLAKDFESESKRFRSMCRKQEQLLFVAFHLLLNLAEDVTVEVKMCNKGIIQLLVAVLDRGNLELRMLSVTFLKKLSIFSENNRQMALCGATEKLSRLVPHENDALLSVTLRLLHNLSFDAEVRSQMAKCGLVPKLVTLIANEVHRVTVLSILYHISMDDRFKSMFTYTDAIPMVMKMVLESAEERVAPELMALCINLAANARNSQLICDGSGLKLLIRRAIKTKDTLLMKMIRNISQHPGPTKMRFLDHIHDLVTLMKKTREDELLVEVLGILGNMNIAQFDFRKLLTDYDLVPFINERLLPGAADDDVVLEIVILVGTLASDDSCGETLAQSGVINNLIDLLNAKQEDDEMVLQIVYVFYQMIFNASTREVMLNQTQAVAYLIDLMHDKNSEIRKMCDATLDIIMERDNEWARKIRYEKFRWHNAQWLEIVEAQQAAQARAGSVASSSQSPPVGYRASGAGVGGYGNHRGSSDVDTDDAYDDHYN